MLQNKYDVVIAGAGPAGCASAIRLRQLNLSVCLVDDVNASQFKVGESIPGATIRLLNRLGIPSIEAFLSKDECLPCVANTSAWGSEEWTFNDAISNPEGGGWHIVRHRFESKLRALASENGVHFIEAKIGRIRSSKEEHQIYFKTNQDTFPEGITAKWIIDATGRASSISKQFEVARNQFEEQMAAVCWIKHENDQDMTTRIKSVENGWWYSSKLPDGNRVISFHGITDDIAKLTKSIPLFIDEANKSQVVPFTISAAQILEGVVARNASSSKSSEVIGDNWLAVGDAALSFDPLSSQGIFFALYSGVRAAETIASILNSPEHTSNFTSDYRLKVQNVFEANQNTRKYHYTSERRFMHHPYWKQYLK